MSNVMAMASPASGTVAKISGLPAAGRGPVVQPLATTVGPGVGAGVGSVVGSVRVGLTDADGRALTDGELVGEGAPWQPVATTRAARMNAARRRGPAGIGLVGVVLEPAHGGQGCVAQKLRLALEKGQLGPESGGGVGRLEEALLA
jgi:hypothetical protein